MLDYSCTFQYDEYWHQRRQLWLFWRSSSLPPWTLGGNIVQGHLVNAMIMIIQFFSLGENIVHDITWPPKPPPSMPSNNHLGCRRGRADQWGQHPHQGLGPAWPLGCQWQPGKQKLSKCWVHLYFILYLANRLSMTSWWTFLAKQMSSAFVLMTSINENNNDMRDDIHIWGMMFTYIFPVLQKLTHIEGWYSHCHLGLNV